MSLVKTLLARRDQVRASGFPENEITNEALANVRALAGEPPPAS